MSALPSINECVVTGWVANNEGEAVEGVQVTAELLQQVTYDAQVQVGPTTAVTTTDTDGYWELSLINTAEITPSNTKYRFTFLHPDGKVKVENKSVPNSPTSLYAVLT